MCFILKQSKSHEEKGKILKSELAKIKLIRKRSGEVVPFDLDIVARAIFKAFEVTEKEANQNLAWWLIMFSELS